MMKKKKLNVPGRRWILANNPSNNNQCQCFDGQVPSHKWFVISRFKSEDQCRQMIDHCNSYYKINPLREEGVEVKKKKKRRR